MHSYAPCEIPPRRRETDRWTFFWNPPSTKPRVSWFLVWPNPHIMRGCRLLWLQFLFSSHIKTHRPLYALYKAVCVCMCVYILSSVFKCVVFIHNPRQTPNKHAHIYLLHIPTSTIPTNKYTPSHTHQKTHTCSQVGMVMRHNDSARREKWDVSSTDQPSVVQTALQLILAVWWTARFLGCLGIQWPLTPCATLIVLKTEYWQPTW